MRFIVAVIVLFALNANNGALGFIAPVTKLLNPLLNTLQPVVDILPIDLGELLQSLGICVNPRPDPELENEIERYRRGDRQACCQAENFPRIFTAFAKLSQCFVDIFASTSQTVCSLLGALAPITGCRGNEQNPGCLLKSLLGPIFGEVGELLAALIVDVLEPLNPIDGCITSGSTQMYHRIVFGGRHRNAVYGDSQTPLGTVAGAALGGVFAISRCLPEPIATMSLGAWQQGIRMVTDRCESQIRRGFWKRQWEY